MTTPTTRVDGEGERTGPDASVRTRRAGGIVTNREHATTDDLALRLFPR
jgi:hypothetical protein